jgi:S-DNA-T family DNA segregation ATPase FtsK/SpoIIIE
LHHFLTDDKFKIILGVALIFFGAYLMLSFVSYFFTWKADQSFENGEILSGAGITVENWSGKSGAKIARFFINSCFGISSFGFPFLLFIFGFRLITIKLLPLRKTFFVTLTLIVLTSLILGFLFGTAGGFLGSGLGGSYGYFVTQWLNSVMGIFGTALLLLLVTLFVVFFTVSTSVTRFKNLISAIFGRKPAAINQETAREPKQSNTATVQPESEQLEENFKVIHPVQNETSKKVDDDVELTIEEHIPREEDPMPVMRVIIPEPEEVAQQLVEEIGAYDPTLDLKNYKYPPVELLEDHKSENSQVSNEELISNKNKIVETLGNYKIQIDKIKATIGPTVTLYEIVPAPGIRISSLLILEIRIPGAGTIS